MSKPAPRVRAAPSRSRRLIDALSPGPVLILMHDNPDPDCLASAAGVRTLLKRAAGIESVIAYGGLIGRASTKALIAGLDLEVRHIDQIHVAGFPHIVTVDTQPLGGNNALPHDRQADAVLDHHALRKATRSVPYVDVRTEYGATCTMVAEYLHESEIEIDPRLATLLFYAIRTETQELGREASQADIEAYMDLFPLADLELISSVERARIPLDWFETWHRAISGARLHGSVAVAPIGPVDNPDMIPEVADMLLRLEGVDWTLVTGSRGNLVLFSLRTNDDKVNAGVIAQKVVGKKGTAGGHDTMAGGRVPLRAGDDPAATQQELADRLLKALDVRAEGAPMLGRPPAGE
jgi:nanoRNase/pAp phosphatase (c-di-AMP/oligoRNAs hydrolase)